MVKCYYKNDDNPNLIRSINSGVCMGSGSAAGIFSCCFPWDQCLPSGLCHANSSSTYYTALCTDQTLQDSSCQKGCNGLYRTGVTYNTTDDLWACCDASDKTCSTSKNATFEAPAPDLLLQQTMTIVDFIPTATGATTTASATASATVSTSGTSGTSAVSATPSSSQAATTEIPSQHSSGSSLSTGAIAGISVGIVVVVIAIITGLVFWLLKRKKRNKNQGVSPAAQTRLSGQLKQPMYGEMPEQTYNGSIVEKQGRTIVEAPTPYSQHRLSTGIHPDRGGLHELH